MTKTYINTGFVPGASEYVETSDTAHVSTVSFASKASTVKVSTASQRMVSNSLTVVAPFGVAACEDGCEVGQLNETIKVQINVRYGEPTSITNMRAELNRLLDIWQANNMAYGVVPPIDTNISE